jgi:hypothetical protein
MRDRREVLKLLAGGTAVAAGASLVTTSTAFAFGGTTSCRPNNGSNLPSISLTSPVVTRESDGTGTSGASLTVNGGTDFVPNSAVCAECHPGVTPSASIEYRWSVEVPTGTTGTYGVLRSSSGSPMTAFAPVPIDATVFLRRTDTTYFPGLTGNGSIDFTIRLTVRWVCTNQFGRTRNAWRCSSFLFVVRYQRSGSTISMSLNSGPTPDGEGGLCNSAISA